ncbi:MAG: DNA topoisomerase IV subunit B [Gemmatales bacterium]
MTYTAKDIQVLEGLEPVRRRPSMYIGGVDIKGLHHLVWEIVDNCVDEYLNGHGDLVHVTLHKKGDAVTIVDNGRGIPVDIHPKHKKSALELILSTLHSGAKFGEGDSYFHSGGLHGVGSSVVNALSKKLVATIKRDGNEWMQAFSKGKALANIKKVGSARGHGTSIYFEPDPEIFRVTNLDADTIKNHLDAMAYIHSGLKITFKDEVKDETYDLTHSGGLLEFLGKIVKENEKAPVTEIAFNLPRTGGEREAKVECALQWTESTEESIRSYVNGIRTISGGTHENGFKAAIVKAIRNYIETHDVKIKGISITAEDIREGVVGLLSVFVREPKFQGQTKERLNNEEMTSHVDGVVRPALEAWLNNNKASADRIVGRIVLAARAREASRAAVQDIKRKSVAERKLNLPGKLADCSSTNLDETELFIVEGESAGGSAIGGRNRKTQAILPLRGKILNSEGLPIAKVVLNQEISNLIAALGTGIGDKFDINRLRYGKIILLMDADYDGHHISTLLLTFFFRYLPQLIKDGRVFLAQPPLYRVVAGKEAHWARDDAHKEQILAGLRNNAKYVITRFKGLGEMNSEVLGETTLNPRSRTLLQVDVDNTLEADQMFVTLMGKDPSLRYEFIMNSAAMATAAELDV